MTGKSVDARLDAEKREIDGTEEGGLVGDIVG